MIHICIPVHEEASTVGVLLWKLRKVIGDFGRDYRIVVHDDASRDDTLEVLERYKRALPLTVLKSEERIGYGASVERLLRYVSDEAPYPKRDCAVVLQGDFTEDPEDVVSLVKVLEGGADIVAGRVEIEEGDAPSGVRWVRRFARLLFRRLVRTGPVSDPLSGLRAYRVIVLRKAFRDLPQAERVVQSDGWAANVELLGALAPHARRIAEAPLRLRYDLQVRPSRFRPWSTAVALFRIRGAAWTAGVGPEAA